MGYAQWPATELKCDSDAGCCMYEINGQMNNGLCNENDSRTINKN